MIANMEEGGGEDTLGEHPIRSPWRNARRITNTRKGHCIGKISIYFFACLLFEKKKRVFSCASFLLKMNWWKTGL